MIQMTRSEVEEVTGELRDKADGGGVLNRESEEAGGGVDDRQSS